MSFSTSTTPSDSTSTSTTWTTTDITPTLNTAMTNPNDAGGGNGGGIVINVSPTTVIQLRTIGFVSTITDGTIPPITLDPAPPTTTVFVAPTPTVIGTYRPTTTVTLTTLAATYYFQDVHSSIYSTSVVGLPLSTATGTPQQSDDSGSGWDSWSAGAKAGLIIGVVFGVLLLLMVLTCCYKRNARWIAHDWRWAPQVGAPTGNNMAMVATPSYGYAYPTYMRGGHGSGGREWGWWTRVVEKVRAWSVRRRTSKGAATQVYGWNTEEEPPSTPIRVLREMRLAREERNGEGRGVSGGLAD
ncbi:uncharacterized protein AB675_878 [Cyphellophora attinorum]|uniref:Uncharacterized protein n=1 Tax=Cyphellophora attinorum TaxID=1664694 RepID=A0A0N1HXW0_9EURO|nr:uncharacterized protein AB675_878 [Phialophora attinorum]KPI45514.1 hypothetical protein AB675_878 [Phialophora attinorum]